MLTRHLTQDASRGLAVVHKEVHLIGNTISGRQIEPDYPALDLAID